MRVVVTGSGLSWSRTGFVAGLPVAVGALVVAIVTVGPLATAVAIVIGVPLLLLLLQGVARLARARVQKRSERAGPVAFAAEATLDGVPGTFELSPTVLEWRSRRAGRDPIAVPLGNVTEVEIRPINLLFFQAARITVRVADGREVKLAVTAKAADLRRALLAVG